MSEPSQKSAIKRSIWLGIAVGWLVQIGLKTILPNVVLIGARFWSLEAESRSLWLENPSDSSHPVWYALQTTVFIGSIFAGGLAARLAPRGSLAVPITLVGLSLLTTGFEQFPGPLSAEPLSSTVVFIWAGGPCVGLVVGVLLARLLERGNF
jgi:hypothetical protein